MATINKSGNNRCWQGCRERGTLTLLVGMQTGAATLENSMEVSQKFNRTILQPSNCITRYLSKEHKNTTLKGYMYSNVYSNIINNSQIMEIAQMSIDWWMVKEEVVSIYNGILLSHQKEWNLTICNDVDGARDYYAKWNKSVKERQIP